MSEEKKKKNWEDDKCRREVDEEREDEENYKKKVFEEGKESRYDNVRDRRREELECSDFHKISYQWHDDDLEQFHEKEKLEEKRERELRESEEREDKWVNFFFLFDVYINRF